MMMEDTGAVTWNQLIGASTALTSIFLGGFGLLWKRINNNTQAIADHRFDVAKNYATTNTVIQIEQRLTDSINRMSEQLTGSITHLTNRFEALFDKVLAITAHAAERGKAEG